MENTEQTFADKKRRLVAKLQAEESGLQGHQGTEFLKQPTMPRYRNPDSEVNIKRIDSRPHYPRQSHGFQVHFRRSDGHRTKFFSDGIYGGKEEAREEARKFRSFLEKTLPEITHFVQPIRASAVGYSFREWIRKDGTKTLSVSVAARDRKGHAVNRQIRVLNGDLEGAVKEALAWRESILEKRLKIEKSGSQ